MARARLPAAKAKAAAADIKNPQRFRNRKTQKGARPLGVPYTKMTIGEKKAWKELSAEMPWLKAAHRPLARLACYWIAKLDGKKEFGVSATQALSSVLSKLGATPVDETKVVHGGDDEADPSDKYF